MPTSVMVLPAVLCVATRCTHFVIGIHTKCTGFLHCPVNLLPISLKNRTCKEV